MAGLVADAEPQIRFVRDAVAEQNGTFAGARSQLLILGLVGALLAVGVAVLLTRAIVGPVGQMMRAADGIAGGDVNQSVDVKSGDELGQTARAFARMIDYLRELAGVTERIAGGDLTVRPQPRSDKDLLGTAMLRLVTDLERVVGDVSASAGTVASASNQMASTSEEAGRAVGEIASAVGDVAQGAERQVRMVETARDTALETARAARRRRRPQARRPPSRAMPARSPTRTQQTSAATQEIASSAAELARTAESLERLVGHFTLAV
jgi:methyl-accepting chemotaxis protein